MLDLEFVIILLMFFGTIPSQRWLNLSSGLVMQNLSDFPLLFSPKTILSNIESVTGEGYKK